MDTDRGGGGGTPSVDGGAGLPDMKGGAPDEDGRLPVLALEAIGGVFAAGGTLLLVLGGPIRLGGGGGGVAAVALLGSFLLTHFFKSLS